MTNAEAKVLYEELVAVITREIPGFTIRFKTDSRLQRLIGFVLRWVIPFNRRYMTDYTSTFYPDVFFPSRAWLEEDYWGAFKILAHEYVHLFDGKEDGPQTFSLKYVMPQLFALPFLAVFIVAWWAGPWWLKWWALGSTVLNLLPLPAVYRMRYELRGYAMGLFINHVRHSSIKASTIAWMVDQFVKSGYYFMWPFRKNMTGRMAAVAAEIKAGHFTDDVAEHPYAVVKRILTRG